jgi:hypothetical protein
MTAPAEREAQASSMTLPLTPAASHRRLAIDGDAPALNGEDALMWAQRVWDDRDTWLRARGGVESVFMAAQLLGCREEAVRWLRATTRL